MDYMEVCIDAALGCITFFLLIPAVHLMGQQRELHRRSSREMFKTEEPTAPLQQEVPVGTVQSDRL